MADVAEAAVDSGGAKADTSRRATAESE